jgi:drug/metabolite transporter superfamily protein YnfA
MNKIKDFAFVVWAWIKANPKKTALVVGAVCIFIAGIILGAC